jgi:hypothetical protein
MLVIFTCTKHNYYFTSNPFLTFDHNTLLVDANVGKQNITIEIHQKVGNILYVNGVIVQNFNLFNVYCLKHSMTLNMVLLGFNAHWEMEAQNVNGTSKSR